MGSRQLLPLHWQFRYQHVEAMIKAAGPGDLESLRQLALRVLEMAEVNQAQALLMARQQLPRQNAPASEDAEAASRTLCGND